MRPQGFGQVGHSLEDLGWNDMGFEPPKAAEPARDATHDAFGDDVVEHPRAHPTGLTPVGSPVHNQHAEIEDRLATEALDEHSIDEDSIDEEELDETAEPYQPEKDEAPVAPAPAAPAPVTAVATVPPAPSVVVAIPTSAPRRAPRPRSAPGTKGKAAFTLRLDPDRHLRLRLACAVGGRSAQQLVTDALDQLLERIPELDAMAAKAKRKG
jgi:hypothetical protein